MRSSLVIGVLVLQLASCGTERTEVSNAVQGPSSSNSKPSMSLENLQNAMAVHLDRIRQRVGNTALRIQANAPDNRVRRVCLMWQIRTGETMMGASHQKNLVVALVQTWYWAASMERFFTVGRGKEFFADQQAEVIAAVTEIRNSTETLSASYLPAKQVAALKFDIESAIGNGDLFAATMTERTQTMDKILDVTRLESVIGLALSPFNYLGSVKSGMDAMPDLNKTGNRALDLAERYPEMIGWYLQLAALEIQEQEGFSRALSDVHSVSQSVKDLPNKLRQEVQALLESSSQVQSDTRATLSKINEAGQGIERAAVALDQGIRSLDTFVTNAKGPADQPGAPKGEPFRIQDYTAAAQAMEGTAKQITSALQTLNQTIQSPETRAQIEGLMQEADLRLEKARQESEVLLGSTKNQADQLIDHAAKRAAQLVLMIAVLVLSVTMILRVTRRR